MSKTKKPIEDWERIEEDEKKPKLRQERKQDAKRG